QHLPTPAPELERTACLLERRRSQHLLDQELVRIANPQRPSSGVDSSLARRRPNPTWSTDLPGSEVAPPANSSMLGVPRGEEARRGTRAPTGDPKGPSQR